MQENWSGIAPTCCQNFFDAEDDRTYVAALRQDSVRFLTNRSVILITAKLLEPVSAG
jgi:hypothetical protein